MFGLLDRNTATNVDPSGAGNLSVPIKRHPLRVFLKDLSGARKLANKNHLSLLASSVSFFCIFSLCPFLIICFVGSQHLLAHIGIHNSNGNMNAFLGALFPNLDPTFAQSMVDILHANALSNVVSLALLCWSTYELFVCLHTVFSKISTHGSQRNFFFSNLMSVVCFLIVSGACTITLLLSTTNIASLQMLAGQYVDGVSVRLVRYIAYAIALFSVIISITTIYKLMPTQKIKIKNAFRASLLFVALFLVGRATYQLYVIFFKVMNASVYGALLQLLIILIWIYFLSRAFLFAAQYAIFLEEKGDR